jgi:hypothetical protein
MQKKINLTLFTIAMILLSSCYRMPSEDDYSLIPMTNNPDFRNSGDQIPGVKY